jgi:hypothetical protein
VALTAKRLVHGNGVVPPSVAIASSCQNGVARRLDGIVHEVPSGTHPGSAQAMQAKEQAQRGGLHVARGANDATEQEAQGHAAAS